MFGKVSNLGSEIDGGFDNCEIKLFFVINIVIKYIVCVKCDFDVYVWCYDIGFGLVDGFDFF